MYLQCTPAYRRWYENAVDQIPVLPEKINQNEWLQIANDYEEKLNFPNCVGSIDGKHINIPCPDNSGSIYHNYNHFHSIVLLAICDANYVFRVADVGAYSRRSDGGILKESVIGKKFEACQMNLPDPAPVSNTRATPLPYCLVGDEAFPFKPYLLRPYPGKQSTTKLRRVFNYRLSRARKTIEQAFGILVARWRIFRSPIAAIDKHVIDYVKVALCLHNWLRLDDIKNNSEDSYSNHQEDQSGYDTGIPGGLSEVTRTGSNNSTTQAEKIREEFCAYFNNEGAYEWQYDYI